MCLSSSSRRETHTIQGAIYSPHKQVPVPVLDRVRNKCLCGHPSAAPFIGPLSRDQFRHNLRVLDLQSVNGRLVTS